MQSSSLPEYLTKKERQAMRDFLPPDSGYLRKNLRWLTTPGEATETTAFMMTLLKNGRPQA